MADNTNRDTNSSDTRRQIPKNLRQIGKISDGLKIYVEDYVKTFVRQLAETEPDEITAAVLVGDYVRNEQDRFAFIYGAIRIENIWNDDEIKFNEETWTSIYETIKHYFPDGEIVGWYIKKNEWTERNYDLLKAAHLDNFAGRDKVLLQYDLLEKDGDFYCYENDALIPQSGYFIYYDKNEEMQDYMIDNKQSKREEELVEDRAVREFRVMYQEKHPPEKKNQKQSVVRMMYAAGAVIAMVVMAVGITAINNYEKMKGLEETLQTISNSLISEGGSPVPTKAAGGIFENVNKGNNNQESNGNISTPLINEEASVIPSAAAEPSITAGPSITAEPSIAAEPSITAGPLAPNVPGITGGPVSEQVKGADKEVNTEPTITPIPEEKEQEVLKAILTADQLTTYKVEAGDTLAGICYKLYGNINQIKLIQDLNQIVDKNKIFIGQELVVPK